MAAHAIDHAYSVGFEARQKSLPSVEPDARNQSDCCKLKPSGPLARVLAGARKRHAARN